MNDTAMRQKIEDVLAGMELKQLEDRIAPVKCDKNPEAPECQPVARYGVVDDGSGDDPVVRYGVGF